MWNNEIVLHDTQLAHVFCPSFGWRNEADKRVAHLQLQACLYWRRRPGVAHREVWDNHDKCLPRNLPSVTKFTFLYEKNKVRIKGHILRPEVSYGLKQYYYGCYLLVIILSTLSYEILTFKLTFSSIHIYLAIISRRQGFWRRLYRRQQRRRSRPHCCPLARPGGCSCALGGPRRSWTWV